MKRWLKWIVIIGLAPIGLVLLVSVLLYIPAIQNYAVKKATTYASEVSQMKIDIEKVRLSFPLDLTVKGVEVIAPPADTLLLLESLRIGIHPLPLLKKEISLSGMTLKGARVNTGQFIDGIEIKGLVGTFKAYSDRISLTEETARLNLLELSDASLTVIITDTTQKDTTATAPLNWKILLDEVSLHNVLFALQMPLLDSMQISTAINKAVLAGGTVDLASSTYEASRFTLDAALLNYDANTHAPAEGLDVSHIRLKNINFRIDSIFNRGLEANASIREFRLEERSGLSVTSLAGEVYSDSISLQIPRLSLQTPHSEAELAVALPWSALDKEPTDVLSALFSAKIGKEDILMAAGELKPYFLENLPERPLTLSAKVDGNYNRLNIARLEGDWPGVLRLNIFGVVKALNDSLRTSGDFSLTAEGGNLNFLKGLLPVSIRETYRIPFGMKLSGKLAFQRNAYQTALLLKEGNGRVQLTGRYNTSLESYKVDLKVDSLEPVHFMPKDSLFWITAQVQAEGKGLDVFKKKTWATVDGKLTNIRYGSNELSDVTLSGSLKEHALKANLHSLYPLAVMDILWDGTLRKDSLDGMLIADVQKLDIQGFHWVDMPLTTSFQIFSEAKSNLKNNHQLDVSLGNWKMEMQDKTYEPKMLTLHLRADDDTTRLSFHAGDFGILLTGNANAQKMVDQLTKTSDHLFTQFKRDSLIDFTTLRPLLPELHLQVRASTDNPIYNYLQENHIFFDSLSVEGFTSPESGIQLNSSLFSFINDTTKIDTIRLAVWQDSLGLRFTGDVKKNRFRMQEPFTVDLKGQLQYGWGEMEATYLNGEGETGLQLGVKATKIPGGFSFHLYPENLTIAFLPFTINKDNYFNFRSMKDMDADVRLTGQRFASLAFHTERDSSKMVSLQMELSQISLDTISRGFAGFPEMKGNLNASVRYEPSETSFMVAGGLTVDSMMYQGSRVGEILLSAVYLPLENGEHQFDVHLFRDEAEVSSLFALYSAGKNDKVEGNLSVHHLPLEMVSPFIPNGMARMNGALVGDMAISGSTEKPLINGFLRMDTATMYVVPAGTTVRFDSIPVDIKDNLFTFRKYKINTEGNNPFIIDGTIDAQNLNRMTADLKLTANNMLLLNTKRTNESLVYGKLLVNLNSTVKGRLEALQMRGNLEVLGSTNVTYVMKDSPLAVQDRLSGLVTFTYFEDTIPQSTSRFRRGDRSASVGGMDILLTIHVDPVVRLNADLSADQSNQVELVGGGDLTFQYTPQGDMNLTGRYTMTGGNVKYAFPVIGTKDLVIKDGSYVDWSGDMMDPYLNLTATERVRVSVAPAGQSSRLVNFDAGIEIKQRMENLSLQFTLAAPEDISIQDELTALGEEERNKRAIAMLVTGMYLADGSSGSGGLDMGNALNSFLQSEINNLAGSVLKGVDVSFGMESYNDGSGASDRTDYSFRFSKRFYNDRINIILGGRISTGREVEQNQSFIDDASIEYRLDEGGTRYVKLFHNKNFESLLEGEIIETGAGIVFRRKMKNMGELLIFRKKKPQPVNEVEGEKDE